MLGQTFYHQTIRNSIVAFGNLFTGIQIVSNDSSGNPARIVTCPISYAKKEQWFARLKSDSDFQAKFEIDLPRLSFEVTGYQYNPAKKMGPQSNMLMQQCGVPALTYAPTPWRLGIQLYAYSKNQEDSLQITEQILPYFQPNMDVNISVLSEFKMTMDVPITLVGVSTEDNYEDLNNNRMIIDTYSFTMDIQIFGPIDNKANVIKEVTVKFIPAVVNDGVVESSQPFNDTYDAQVVPRTANKTDTHTIEETWTVL